MQIDVSQTVELCHAQAETYLERDKTNRGYVCPMCGSGSGRKGTGMTTKDGIHFRCWGCGEIANDDIIDIIAKRDGYQTIQTVDKIIKVCEELKIQPITKGEQKQTGAETAPTPTAQRQEAPAVVDYMDYYRECVKHIGETGYMTARGISEETLRKFHIGYDAHFTHGLPSGESWQAIIIPTSRSTFTARRVGELVIGKGDRIRKKGGSSLFNTRALASVDTGIFVVEGEIDALSIIEAGGVAVALGSTSNKDKLLSEVRQNAPKQTLLVALDNDEPGQQAQAELLRMLEESGIPARGADTKALYLGYKDANEALVNAREQFITAVGVEADRELQAEREAYEKLSSFAHMDSFIKMTQDTSQQFFPTGFKALDELLDGGFYRGLYVIGAISSLGKTTAVLQIADKMAELGNDVLIFSLEMERYELIGKSVSRHTFINARKQYGSPDNAKTYRGIVCGDRYSRYSEHERELIQQSIHDYGEYSSRVFIVEGQGLITAQKIREVVKRHIRIRKTKPVVFIDYLQIIAPADARADMRVSTNETVTALKQISRDYLVPIVTISALNRQNYNKVISFEAFKESGGIDYGADIIIGLQLKGVGKKGFDVNKAKSSNPREVELVLLKNRNGKTGLKLTYKYYPMFNYIEEESEFGQEVEDDYSDLF